MKIKKIGHCCLVITTQSMTDTEKSVTIMTDPGVFTDEQNELKGIDIVLITHNHQDHFHVESLKKIIDNNPKVAVLTNATVGATLDKEGIPWERVGNGEKNDTHGTLIEGYGHRHAVIFEEWGETENTGYFIDSRLFYPGDAFTDPERGIEILALPAAGPWMKLSDALSYTISQKPHIVFPVHDVTIGPSFVTFLHKMIETVLRKKGINFVPLLAGEEKEL